MLDCKIESSVCAEAVNNSFQTPASRKVAKTGKTSRAAKSNRMGPQTPVSNAGGLTILISILAVHDPLFLFLFLKFSKTQMQIYSGV